MQIPKKHSIFLLDAIGAAVSIAGLFFLYTFDDFFGMPPTAVVYFIGIAGALCLYSWATYLIRPKNWKPLLKLLAVLNISYCLFTMYQVYEHRATLTPYGYAYLIIEVLIILLLAGYELKQSGSDAINWH
ncbi:MAG: hypothetical protein NTW29_15640 [Bacteroidetes bacterium]|nr:hypothetical protein [Bacteroidota bacterium]